MNVTAVNQLTVASQATQKAEVEDGTAFSQKLNKHLALSQEKESDDLTEDLTKSDVKAKVKADTQDSEEEKEFVIIPTFLRIDRELKQGSIALTDLHKENQTMDSTVIVESLKTQVIIGDSEEIEIKTIAQGDGLETALTSTEMGSNIELETTHLTAISQIETDFLEHMESIQLSSKQETAVTEIMETNSLVKEQATLENDADETTLNNLKNAAQKVEEKEAVQTDFLHKKVQLTENKMKSPLNHSFEANQAEQVMSESPPDNSTEELLMNKDTAELSVREKYGEALNSKTMDVQAMPQTNLTQVVQSNDFSDKVIQPSLPAASLEESPEIIQDLMMTVSSKGAGDKVYQSTLTLTPETLGKIKVEMTYSNEGLTGSFVFQTEEAKQWIEHQWQEMKAPLEMKGLQFEGFEFKVVEARDFAQAENLNFSQQSDQSKRNQQEEHRKSIRSKQQNGDEETVDNKPAIGSGIGLNYYA